jgi:hypothetical protein
MSVGDLAGETETVELQMIVGESTQEMLVVELMIAEDY